ncbi:sigma-70 family RNA polymerase sigma factor [Gimibacter soli]|uniref:RNA polymerase sigma factor n=1 Tax=Gimibacter soli TaxID=3024400 RepID=A0AAE9XQK5_9PROT|nr:sigma-70 family RNA polymerase sigma factor [Gimibacter soli]WCL54551.1 sigma-70 family RNA polymerase sigma factor [Gimibacter soli]
MGTGRTQAEKDTKANAAAHAALIARIATGADRTAFAELFAWYGPRLKAFALKGGLEDSAADDLVQDVMLTVWRKAALFDPAKAAASTWIFTILRNRRIDLLRRGTLPTQEIDAAERVAADGEDPEEATSGEQLATLVKDRMASLSPEQAEVIHKAFFEDKSHSDVAAELGLPLGTVKSRIRLALAHLRGRLEKEIEVSDA